MEINSTKTEEIKWDIPAMGQFNATVENNRILNLEFCETGADCDRCLKSNNEEYLRAIHKALTGLFKHLDKDRNFGRVEPEIELEADFKGLNID